MKAKWICLMILCGMSAMLSAVSSTAGLQQDHWVGGQQKSIVVWTEVTSSPSWSGRMQLGVLPFDNKLWILGGGSDNTGDSCGYISSDNTIYNSVDGSSWTLVSGGSRWSARCGHATAVFNNKIWVLGGAYQRIDWDYGCETSTTYMNDVWSSVDGQTWIQVKTNAPWSARSGLRALVHDNKLWIVGGNTNYTRYNDVWWSTDGDTWTQATSQAGWSARSGHTAVVYNDKMWVLGGWQNSSPWSLNDVWYSTNGSQWSSATTNAAWPGRGGHASVVFANQLWVLGGGSNLNDIWHSTDGISWTQAMADTVWTGRWNHAAAAYDNKLWVLGGQSGNFSTEGGLADIWSMADITPPTIILEGNAEMSLECGEAFEDPGAVATVSGMDISGSIVVGGDAVNGFLPGSYEITYDVNSPSGVAAERVTRTVTVIDTTPPQIAAYEAEVVLGKDSNCKALVPDLSGSVTVVEACTAVEDLVFTQLPIVGSEIETDTLVQITVADRTGREDACQIQLTIQDITAPVITLIGANPMIVECGEGYEEPFAVATDNCDGDMTSKLDVFNTVNTSVPGEYELEYRLSSSDAAGNVATAVKRTVVVQDTLPPVLTLKGETTHVVECGDAFSDPGVEAMDKCDGNLANLVQTDGLAVVNPSIPGNYILTYNVMDGAGNGAIEITRVVQVKDRTKPVITLNGANPTTIPCKGTYVEAGASVMDTCQGSLEATIAGTINNNVPGSYTITYNATDQAANTAIEVTRTVIVEDANPPVLELLGTAEVTVRCGEQYVEPGVRALDECEGDLSGTVQAVETPQPGAPGRYIRTYTVSDSSGNAATPVTRTIIRESCTVPNVLGMTEANAHQTITGAGFSFAVEYEFDNTVAAGRVIRQTPAANIVADAGSTVTVYLSKGIGIVTPTLAGSLQADAINAVTSIGLSLGNILPAHSVDVPEGRVIAQTPLADLQVAPGTVVAFTVSVGPMRGDANLDNRVSLQDVQYCLQIVSGATPSDPRTWTTADVDNDGAITSNDASEIMGYHRNGGNIAATPSGIRAESGASQITLSWNPVTHPNLAGYVAYRRMAGGIFERIGAPPDTFFVDTSVETERYLYYITTVDMFGNIGAVHDLNQIDNTVEVLANTVRIWIPEINCSIHANQLRVPINFGSVRGIVPKSMSFTINYNTDVLTYVRTEQTILSKEVRFDVEATPGQLLLISINPSAKIVDGEGRFFDLFFSLKLKEVGASSSITINDVMLLDQNDQKIEISIEEGAVNVGDNEIWGDLDGNGLVEQEDALLLLEICVGLESASDYQRRVGDINGDGRLDVADAVLILRIAAGQSINPNDAKSEGGGFSSEDRMLSIPQRLEPRSVSFTMPVSLDNVDGLAGLDLIVAWPDQYLRLENVTKNALVEDFSLDLSRFAGQNYVRIGLSKDMPIQQTGSASLLNLHFTAIGDITTNENPAPNVRILYAEIKGAFGESQRWYGRLMRKDARVIIRNNDGSNVSLFDVALTLSENLAQLDSNNDQELSYSEVYAYLPWLLQNRFNELDSNGDGNLTRTELQAYYPVALTSVVGKTEDEAREQLAELGLAVEVVYEYSDAIASGLVISQLPVAGQTIPVTQVVTLTVSLGPAPVEGEGEGESAGEGEGEVDSKKYVLVVSIEGKGTVQVTPESDRYNEGVAVELRAVPEDGYEFSSWKGDLSGTNNPASVVMYGDKNITAIFDEEKSPGCCSQNRSKMNAPQILNELLGDYLLIGLSILVLMAMTSRRKPI